MPAQQQPIGDEVRVRPREPLILRSVPAAYYENHQLASAVQSVEAALFSICFCQYPQAFMTMYSGLEKLCKNIAHLSKKENFHVSWEAAGKKLNLLQHPLFEKLGEPKRFFVQSHWSSLRNDIEHQGDSPSYDLRAANLLFGSLWDAYQLFLIEGYNFNLEGSFLPDTTRSLKYTRKILQKILETTLEPSSPYFVDPLTAQLRWLTLPTFLAGEFNFEKYVNSGMLDENTNEWGKKIASQKPRLDWEKVECPVCGSAHSILGFEVYVDGSVATLHFEAFFCPECNFTTRDNSIHPFMAEQLLSENLDKKIKNIANGFRENSLVVSWGENNF